MRYVISARFAENHVLAWLCEPHVGVASGHGVRAKRGRVPRLRSGQASDAVERRRPRWGRPAMRRTTAKPAIPSRWCSYELFGIAISAILIGLLAAAGSVFALVVPFDEDDSIDEGLFTNIQSDEPDINPVVQLLNEDRKSEAVKEARRFIRAHPSDPTGYELLGASLISRRQLNEAEGSLQKALRLNPNRPITMSLLGQIANENRDSSRAEEYFTKAIELEPDLGIAYRGRGLARFRLGRIREAQSDVKASVSLSNGRDLASKQLLAQILYEQGKAKEAEPLLTEILNITPKSDAAIVLQGLVKLELDKLDEASDLFHRLDRQHVHSEWAQFGLSVVDRLDGRWAKAQQGFSQLTKKHPDWWLPFFQLGESLLAQNQLDTARQAFMSAAKVSSNHSLLILRAAERTLSYGGAKQAFEMLKSAENTPENARIIRLLRTQANILLQNPTAAEEELRGAIGNSHIEPTALMDLGRFYMSQSRPGDALAQFQAADKLLPENLEILAAKAQAYVQLKDEHAAIELANHIVVLEEQTHASMIFIANIYEQLGRMDEAEKIYQAILEEKSDQMDASLAFAKLLAKTQRLNEAARTLNRLAASHPEDLSPRLELALLYEQANRIDEAKQIYRFILQEDPRQLIALNNLAFLLSHDEGQIEEALKLSHRAYELSPNEPQVLDTLGWIYLKKKDRAHAEEFLNRAARISPENPQIRKHLQELRPNQPSSKLARPG